MAKTDENRMELEKKKEFLRAYKRAVIAEKTIEEEIEQLRMQKISPSVVLDGMPHSSKHNDLSGFVAKIEELLDELRESMEKRIELRRDIIRKIEQMNDETEKTILRMRYIHDKNFEEIAERTGYCWRHVQRIYSKAIHNFDMS